MRKFTFYPLLFAMIFFALSSCVTTSKINYFQENTQNDSIINLINYSGPKFQIGDIIDVSLVSNSKDISDLYPHLTSIQIRSNQTYLSGNPVQSGYTVDGKGNVIIPGIGQIHVVDKTKYMLEQEIVDSLKSHILDPVVHVKLLNFKISILGDVKIPGTYQIPNDKVTFIEAIAMCGDLNYSGDRRNIKLIRTRNNFVKEYKIDLTNYYHFDKEYYFLEQNDILFIPTTSVRTNQLNYSQYYLPAISSLSLIVTFINLLK
ncbi:MAG: polysaccharide biosynthesis/export family protein [Bacteroidota bacterium]